MFIRLKKNKFMIKLNQVSFVVMGIITAAASFSPVALAEQIGSAGTGQNTGIKYMRSGWVRVDAKKRSTFTFNCRSGHAISGSIETRSEQNNLFNGYLLVSSKPTKNFRGWQIRFINTDDLRRDFRIHTTCLD